MYGQRDLRIDAINEAVVKLPAEEPCAALLLTLA